MPQLPITRVVLYKHGVGYFEREGPVDGDATLSLTFKQGEVSDVLKSLTVLDLDGGRVSAVSYDSTKPVEQLLTEVALSIPDTGSLTGLLPQLKGARITVTPEAESPTEGVILGVETEEVVTEGRSARRPRVVLLTDAGEARTFDLFGVRIQLQDEGLRRDLDFFLKAHLSSKRKDSRTFTLFAEGDGQRTVRTSYVLEAPVWKATYRILLKEEDSPPLIQGWAVVDNVQDEDWEDVRLSLVAGLPVSFTHDLYTPRYIRRPEVEVRETTGVLPPEVETGELMMAGGAMAAAELPAKGLVLSRKRAPSRIGTTAEDVFMGVSSTPVQTRERQVGDLFEYEIDHPVTVRRNQSALVPIVLKPFEGRSVLLYQKVARPENPMRCVEFKNTTGLTLEGGPVTVLEAGRYVGEAMLDTLKPKEERLVGYAVELGVRVLDNIDSHSEHVHRVTLRKGTLKLFWAREEKTTYTFISKSERDEIVFLDHPRGSREWKLVEPEKPHETTENFWRFRFDLPKGETVKFVVGARQVTAQAQSLTSFNADQLAGWVEQKYLNAATQTALDGVLDLRREAADHEVAIARLYKERDDIHAEQKRIRENLQSLGERASEKELRERFIRTLNTQEDRLEEIERDVRKEQNLLNVSRSGIEKKLASLDYDATM